MDKIATKEALNKVAQVLNQNIENVKTSIDDKISAIAKQVPLAIQVVERTDASISIGIQRTSSGIHPHIESYPNIELQCKLNNGQWKDTRINNDPRDFSYTFNNLNVGDVVYFRGNNPKIGFDAGSGYGGEGGQSVIDWVLIGGKFKIFGNVMSLLQKEGFDKLTEVPFRGFMALFGDQPLSYTDNVVDISELLLPATTVGEEGYSRMFNEMSSIKASPIIAASVYGSEACTGMFEDCESLTEVTCLVEQAESDTFQQFVEAYGIGSGVLYKKASYTWPTYVSFDVTYYSGIPENWTVQNLDE